MVDVLVVAKRGDNAFLVTKNKDETNENPDGFLVNLASGITLALPIQQALKFGYWEEAGEIDVATKESISIATERAITLEEYMAAIESTEKQMATTRKHDVLRDGKKVGRITFGGVPAIEITSQDDPLLQLVANAMVNPVVVEDEDGGTIYSTIGDIQYELAVTAMLAHAGFQTVEVA